MKKVPVEETTPEQVVEAARDVVVSQLSAEMAKDLAEDRSRRHFDRVARSPDVTWQKLLDACDAVDRE